jgi:hypothetical protein
MGSSSSKSSKAQMRIGKPETHAKPEVNGGTIGNGFGEPCRDVSGLYHISHFWGILTSVA